MKTSPWDSGGIVGVGMGDGVGTREGVGVGVGWEDATTLGAVVPEAPPPPHATR
jgi:hypothetical protein